MDLNELTTSDKVIAISGILLFIASFLTWFSAEAKVSGGEDLGVDLSGFGGTVSVNGWDVGFLWAGLPALLGLAAALVVLLPKLTEVRLPDLPVPWSQVLLGAGVLSAVLVVLKLLVGVDGPSSGSESFGGVSYSYEVNRGLGIFLAALSAIAFAVGGYLRLQEGDDATAPPPSPGSGAAPF